jgi:hypothetical protein
MFSILAISSLLFIVLNWGYLIHSAITGKNTSMMPPIGGLSGALACCILPATAGLHRYWWLPMVVDPGFAGVLITAVLLLLGKLPR